MFQINIPTIKQTEISAGEEMRECRRIRNDMSDVLDVLRDMSDLSGEANRLAKFIEIYSENICIGEMLTQALTDLRVRYEKADERSVDFAESCPRHYRKVNISDIQIPVYEGGVIRMI